MQRKAKIFMNNRSQAVRLPKEFQFNTQDVFIRKEGGKVCCLRDRLMDFLPRRGGCLGEFHGRCRRSPVQERER